MAAGSPAPTAGAIRHGCDALGLEASADQLDLWGQYLELLQKWNRAYNLTAVRDPGEMVTRHLLDSLAIADHVHGERLIDIGSGAGLPGVPLAILFPQRQVHLLDSNGKKTRFLFQVKTALGLDNMTIHHRRVESFQPETPYDLVLSRAFASLRDMVVSCRHLLHSQGHFLAMKGARPESEIEACAMLCQLVAVSPITVPGLNEQRHVVELALR